VVLAVFAFSGFESSTALGEEAKDPLRTIPRSVIQSVVLAGAFFVVMAYVVVLGFRRTGLPLAENEAPVATLAVSIGWGALGNVLNVGILLSFFSCTLASINSTARILFAMANHGLISDAIGHAHASNRTPHVAVALSTLATFSVPTALVASGVGAFDAQGYFGTLCSFGFIVAYILISLAAGRYLRTLGELTPKAVAFAAGGVGFMLLPLLGSIGIPGSQLLPPPDGVTGVLVAVFALYMGAGTAWLALERLRRPDMIVQMQSAIDNVHLQFGLPEPALDAIGQDDERARP
jgi:amino acid transporter